MHVKTVLLVLVAGLLLLVSCGEKKTEQAGPFLGGTQGVVADFVEFGLEEDGIAGVYDTETFPIEVTLRNKGEYAVQPSEANVELLGPAPEEFTGIPSRELRNRVVLDKISDLVPDGGEEVITFASDARYTNPVQGFIDRVWFANVEYRYKTFLIIPEVCLKQDITDRRVCEPREEKEFFVSGAPVTVTSVEEDTAGLGIMALKIKIQDVGGGNVAKPMATEFGTNDELTYSIDDPAWECKSGGRVNEARLQADTTEVVCKLKQPLSEGDLFTKQITLTLDYKYRDLVQETVRIKESAG